MRSFGYKTIKNKTASMRSQIRQCNEWIRAPWSLPRGGGQSLILGWPSLFHSPPSSLNENPTECSLTWEDTGNVRDLCLMLPVFPTQAKRSMLSLHDSQSEIGPSFLKVALLCSSAQFQFFRIMWKIPEQRPVLLTDQQSPVRQDVLELQAGGGCWRKRWIPNRAHGCDPPGTPSQSSPFTWKAKISETIFVKELFFGREEALIEHELSKNMWSRKQAS